MKHLVALGLALVVAAPVFAQEPAAPSSGAPAAEKCKIVILNLVGRGLDKDEDLPALLTEILVGEVEVVSGCDVVSQQDIVAMLDYERQKAVCTDGSDSCLAEVGQALGADRVVAGTVGKLGAEFILQARLMNVKKGAVESRAEENIAQGPEKLRRAAKNVGRRLFGVADLPSDAKVDDSPLPSKNGTATPTTGGSSALLWTGGVVAGIGAVAAIVGGVLAVSADQQLGDPNLPGTEKTAIAGEGQVALGAAAVGGLLAIGGGALVAVAMME